MILKGLTLSNFRNYDDKEFRLAEGVNVVSGKNATGKTNLLEAVYLISTGGSFKAKRTEEMIRFGEELSRIKAELADDNNVLNFEVLMTGGEVSGQRTLKRKYFIDGAPKRKKDYIGLFPVVVFWPEDMDMLTGGSEIRRTFMDKALSQVDTNYARSLSTYGQVLRRRNRLLDAIREGTATRHSLLFWDGLLIKHGNVLSDERNNFIDYVNKLWRRSELFNDLKLVYDKSPISEARLLQYKDEELAAGHTLVGPHKDDFGVLAADERDLGVYGSRGEQRMAVLALKLGEIYFIESKIDVRPLLLLDDIFSELDEVHKQEVLRVMRGRQVLVTTAVKNDLDLFPDAGVIEL